MLLSMLYLNEHSLVPILSVDKQRDINDWKVKITAFFDQPFPDFFIKVGNDEKFVNMA